MKTDLNRRTFLKASSVGVASIALHGCTQSSAITNAQGVASRPHVLIIHVD